MTKVISSQEENFIPKALYKGIINLGTASVDCYVLENGQRLISLRGAVKAIAGVSHGKLEDYNPLTNTNLLIIKAGENIPFSEKNAFKSTILKDNSLIHLTGENIEFKVEYTPTNAKGISTDYFIRICEAYVSNLIEDNLKTNRQREIAKNCHKLLSGFARLGLDALVDEATGYQNKRPENELQNKFNSYLAEETRKWAKTFPDELWSEFARLTNFEGCPFTERPFYWSRLVVELIYYAWNPDLAKHLQDNKPVDGKWHQNLSETIGVKALQAHCNQIIGISKTCNSIKELKEVVLLTFSKKQVQTSLKLK